MNPMVGKELRQRMRERRGWILPSLYLLILSSVITLVYYFSVSERQGRGDEIQGSELGLIIFVVVTYTQMTLLLLLAPVFSAGSVTIEKEQRTLPGLLTSLLTVWQIWWGKFVSSLLFLLLLLFTSSPLLCVAFAFGGVSPLQVVVSIGTAVLVLATLSSVGLYCSSFFRRSIHATAVSYAIVVAMTVLTFVAFLLMQAHWQQNMIGGEPPPYVFIPLYFNPFFLCSMAFISHADWYPDFLFSAGAFLLIGFISIFFAQYNLRRSGEQ